MPPELLRMPPTPVAESLRRLDSLVSPYAGVVRGVEEVLAGPEDIRLANLYCETGYAQTLVGHGSSHLGAGSGRSREIARAAAIAEAVERYSACDSDAVPAIVASGAELAGRAVAPARFALFSESQHAKPDFPYARFDAHTPVAWVEGFSLPDGRPALLPAQLVYLAWDLRGGEARIARSTSNGLACHATLEEAVLSGLLELIERDAFMITWKARLSWPRLVWPADSRLGRFERRYLRPTGLRVAAIDLSEFWQVPCVVGLARSAARGSAPVGVGASAATTIARAVEKAVDEAVRVRTWAQALRADDPDGLSVPHADEIVEFDEHIRYYAHDEHARALDFLDASAERRSVRTVAEVGGGTALQVVESLCDRLASRGVTAYGVDVTSPDVRDAGLRVVKVIAPALCPLDVEHAARCLGGRRLYEEPVRLGKRERPLAEDDLNPEPHPFP